MRSTDQPELPGHKSLAVFNLRGHHDIAVIGAYDEGDDYNNLAIRVGCLREPLDRMKAD